jgi:hypothetical protein
MVAQAMQQHLGTPPGASGELPGEDLAERAQAQLATRFDPQWGGFGQAPKFPSPSNLFLLLERAAASDEAREMLVVTLDAMARGGLMDQLAGGFHRYSTDEMWLVPHFEKMLYDNALLLRVYVHAWRAFGSSLHRRIALETADFLIAELRTRNGGFASSLDADTEGVEGRYYVWTPHELKNVLGDVDGAWAAEAFSVTDQGTFEAGASVLQRRADPVESERLDDVRRRLLAARQQRVPPARDDKVVAAWNGLAIAALAEVGALLERPDLIAAAEAAADLLIAVHLVQGPGGVRLRRVSRDGAVGAPLGVLEDYACVAEGLLSLYSVTGEVAWFDLARRLMDDALTLFADDDGGLADTARDAEALITRPADPSDNASPSGRSAAAMALVALAALTGGSEYRQAAERALQAAGRLAASSPRFAGWGLAAAESLLDGPVEVAIVGEPDDPRTELLHRAALLLSRPGLVVALGAPGQEQPPLLAHRTVIEGAPAAFVCRGFVCRQPVTDTDALVRTVDEMM